MRLAQLEALMKEKKVSRYELAEATGIKYPYLSKRILGYIEFNLSEIRKIIKCLKLTDEEIRKAFYLN